jgi:hypothetical protein
MPTVDPARSNHLDRRLLINKMLVDFWPHHRLSVVKFITTSPYS